MPGPYIHISTMRRAAADLADGPYHPIDKPRWKGEDTVQLGQILQDHPNFASLGAIGPDLFFFLPDFRTEDGIPLASVLVKVLDFLDHTYKSLDPYITKWERYIGPLSEDTAEEISRLTGGLSETVGNITGELRDILITVLEDFFVQQRDWWCSFSLGLNHGYDEQAYYWSDMLHYRETGTFARAIWQHANDTDLGSDQARAYALGYITHVATDTTDHAFVNTISGGPYRLHWQRHHLVENHMDASWYLNDQTGPRHGDQYPQFTESALHYDIAFAGKEGKTIPRPSYPTGHTLRENWTRRRKLDVGPADSELPDAIACILRRAMTDVFYKDGKHPRILPSLDESQADEQCFPPPAPGDPPPPIPEGQPSIELIKEAYDLLLSYLKLSTVDGFAHEPPPPPPWFPNLDFPTPTDPHEDPPGEHDGGSFWDDLLNFLLSVVLVLGYIVEVAIYLATLPWALLADLVTFPIRLGLYYALDLPLFQILKTFRAALVMTGYLHPMEDEIAYALIQIGTPAQSSWKQILGNIDDIFGGLLPPGEPGASQTYRDSNYPYAHPDDEFRHPWDYPPPSVPSERPKTTAGPFAKDSNPTELFKDRDSDPGIRDRLETASTPDEADLVGPDLTPTRHLGDGVSFSKYLIWLATRSQDGQNVPMVEWNLDSDRGYGYHCWDWNRHTEPNPHQTKDPEGNPFVDPCTWPSQSDKFRTGICNPDPHKPSWDPTIPLKVHWTGKDPKTGKDLDDPGCDDIVILAENKAAQTAPKHPRGRQRRRR